MGNVKLAAQTDQVLAYHLRLLIVQNADQKGANLIYIGIASFGLLLLSGSVALNDSVDVVESRCQLFLLLESFDFVC